MTSFPMRDFANNQVSRLGRVSGSVAKRMIEVCSTLHFINSQESSEHN